MAAEARFHEIPGEGGRRVDGSAGPLLAFQYIVRHLSDVLPAHVVSYLSGLPAKLQPIRNAANRMVPQALRDLNECLARVRGHMVEGTWADISVGSGKVTTREAEGQMATA